MTNTDTRSVDEREQTEVISAEPAAADQPAPASAAPSAIPFSITALVTAIAGIVLGQWLLSGAAVVFGFLGHRSESARGMSTWGIVLGFAGLFGWILVAIMGVVGAAFAAPFLLLLDGANGGFAGLDQLPAWMEALDPR
ncbi:DUF4190 domain-containing protein [Homoserinibacter sp. YIM 151385]|uniref:DUF4190 domain-containing protein n=1 Tax=Homoserinibacter sp. YIM 151385 TaxID=2985506 RepID=UPI0022F079C8|nr:DUF4190 domain-containing protein [Homoserinibacter sp. YIM 151385]WBU38940.1 DUF4190 domain-containing protein [Homoserinibacter sp. YIM 151385]